MKIVFTGLPYFGKKLVKALSDFDKKNTYLFCDTYYSFWGKLKFILHLRNADKVVSFNGVSNNSGSLNWALRKKKKLIMQWHGSDVLTAKHNKTKGNFNSKYIDAADNYSDAPWLIAELKEIQIEAELLPFKYVESTLTEEKFTSKNVVSYCAQGKEDFYGWQDLLVLSEKFPDINFHVIGTTGKDLKVNNNITCYGWLNQSEVKSLLNKHAIFIRNAKHDGYALSVLEAVANGNYVLWNMPHPCVYQFSNSTDLVEQFSTIQQVLDHNQCARLADAVEWANNNLNRALILENYKKILLS